MSPELGAEHQRIRVGRHVAGLGNPGDRVVWLIAGFEASRVRPLDGLHDRRQGWIRGEAVLDANYCPTRRDGVVGDVDIPSTDA